MCCVATGGGEGRKVEVELGGGVRGGLAVKVIRQSYPRQALSAVHGRRGRRGGKLAESGGGVNGSRAAMTDEVNGWTGLYGKRRVCGEG